MKYFLMTIGVYLLVVCFTFAQKRTVKDGVEYVNFTRDDFKISKRLDEEPIRFDNPLNPFQMFLFLNDTLILSINPDEKNYLGEVYNPFTRKFITKCIPKGRGPGEILEVARCIVSDDKKRIEIVDLNYKKFASYSIDSVLKFGLKYKPKLFDMPSWADYVVVRRDGEVVIRNAYFTFMETIKNDLPPFVKHSNIDNVDESAKCICDPMNVNQGFLRNSYINNDMLFAPFDRPEIQFWNEEFQMFRVMKGPDECVRKYKIRKKDKCVVGCGESFNRYLYTTKKYFYTSYVHGEKGDDSSFSELFKFDYSGNCIARYQIIGVLFGLYIDTKGEYLYGCQDINDYPQIYRYKL